MDPIAVDCPYCRAELAADIDNDPAILASMRSGPAPSKQCPSCAVKVPLVCLPDGRIALAAWGTGSQA